MSEFYLQLVVVLLIKPFPDDLLTVIVCDKLFMVQLKSLVDPARFKNVSLLLLVCSSLNTLVAWWIP